MRTFQCVLCLIVFTTIFVESYSQERRNIIKTLNLLHSLGPKECLGEVLNSTSDRFTSLPTKGEKIHQALKISYKSIFELFKKKKTHGHWNNTAFNNLMDHLHRQAKSTGVPVMSSELEALDKNFKLLDNFLTQQNFSRCACEIARNEIASVLGRLRPHTRLA